MQWYAKAAEDFTKALELYGNNAPQNLHIALAESYLALGEYEQVVETMSQVDIGTNAAVFPLGLHIPTSGPARGRKAEH